MHLLRRFFVFILVLAAPLSGLEVKCCYIQELAQHQSNQKLLQTLLEQELAAHSDMTCCEQVNHLMGRISDIAQALLKNGFSTRAYKIPECDPNSLIGFNCFALWEGEKNTLSSLPLTFFIYVWPSKELALQYNTTHPRNCLYASSIHSHPIPCSFAVLQGTLIQKNYVSLPSCRMVRQIQEQIFCMGESDVDDLSKSFIHQLYNREADPCISLHAYGLGSAEAVLKCFHDTRLEHTYSGFGCS